GRCRLTGVLGYTIRQCTDGRRACRRELRELTLQLALIKVGDLSKRSCAIGDSLQDAVVPRIGLRAHPDGALASTTPSTSGISDFPIGETSQKGNPRTTKTVRIRVKPRLPASIAQDHVGLGGEFDEHIWHGELGRLTREISLV